MKELNQSEKIINGLKLIEKYRPKDSTPYHVRCEHDELIAGSLDWGIPENEMDDLGWTLIEDYDGYRFLT